MARVSKINYLEKTRNKVHDEVECTYNSFYKGGEKYFQIDTYGTKHREFKGKISQSIQFDKEGALELIKLLKEEFDV